MKRMIFFLVACVLTLCVLGAALADTELSRLQPGSEYIFGQYEQDKTVDGKEPIIWIVLDVRDGKALLTTKFALDCKAFNESQADLTWEDSTIRKWLNGEFFESTFNGYEQQAIVLATVPNAAADGRSDYYQSDKGATQDHVFLLSYKEVSQYFSSKDSRKLSGTVYARDNGARFGGITSIGIGETDWWLRSPGKIAHDASIVSVYGDFDTKSVNTKVGIRPTVWVDLSTETANFPYDRFTKAEQLFNDGKYAEAAGMFNSLGEYNNSIEKTKECRYQLASEVAQTGDYDQAIQLYEELDGYKESYKLGRAVRYAKAIMYQDAGDFDTAIKLYAEVGQYEDSMKRLKQCFDKKGISVFYFTTGPVNTGVDNGYKDKKTISNGDKHFGWDMGHFFVSDFTRVVDNNTDNPVFIKTLGDSITLWFELKQDIDKINGNQYMVVAEDTNGSNVTFNVAKTNFGRGTLIIRHKDYQNNPTDPVIYTDYLLAKGTSGANTRVVLNEEGDYEVALDYELQDNDVTHIFSKFDNYQIYFKFSIRNGNCMVYPFDVKTRAELQNTAITQNGFYLDLARSRYLDINVKRSVIVESPTGGYIEDERFNRPASDGDQYTQEGIYTISVSNRYTGESTVKTLFVGTDELLQEYIRNGFNKDRLK